MHDSQCCCFARTSKRPRCRPSGQYRYIDQFERRIMWLGNRLDVGKSGSWRRLDWEDLSSGRAWEWRPNTNTKSPIADAPPCGTTSAFLEGLGPCQWSVLHAEEW